MNSTKRFRVLVVEDEVLLRLDLAAYLENFGYEVVQAGSATEAIALLEMDPSIRVVFTDIRMPGEMDGVALARCIRERWPPTIIVICSGNAHDAVDLADIQTLLINPTFRSTSPVFWKPWHRNCSSWTSPSTAMPP